MTNPPNTAWMWATDDGGVNGATIDQIRGRVLWFEDAAACACGDSSAVQSFEQFVQKGAYLPDIPDDVLSELRQSVAYYAQALKHDKG
ncbi:MAG: hypothetical protein CUN52_07820 [Phototrophicales bacterium]|nr:MAG: hypothetical protein CUN52_07820 [Phototrophicales bacterium]